MERHRAYALPVSSQAASSRPTHLSPSPLYSCHHHVSSQGNNGHPTCVSLMVQTSYPGTSSVSNMTASFQAEPPLPGQGNVAGQDSTSGGYIISSQQFPPRPGHLEAGEHRRMVRTVSSPPLFLARATVLSNTLFLSDPVSSPPLFLVRASCGI